ncbi:MAG: Nramp family divalent metal transporter [Elusimicrobia bacterium]|nr:Nramp family divalent metal transporter [Elusimicrobiota bacterium]
MAEAIDAGQMPAWGVEDIPPPPRGAKGVLSWLGPGVVAMGIAIGTGEWLLGPMLTVKYRGGILWVGLVAVALQLVLNLQCLRYTIATGEPIFTGFMRCRPGPRFWALFYIVIELGSIWPSMAATCATALAPLILGRMPTEADRGFVLFLAHAIVMVCVLALAFGGKVYLMMEKAMAFMVLWILGYLIFVDAFYADASSWGAVGKGFLNFGHIPAGADWLMLAAFANYAGLGGLGNATISNYARDKGWGMGAAVGAIPALVGGKGVQLSHLGKTFPLSQENLSRWRGWWRQAWRDQGLWAVGCLGGIALPAILSLQFVSPQTAAGPWAVAAQQAEGVARQAGPLFWQLTLLCGFWILFSTQLGAVEIYPRRWTDLLWSGFPSLREKPPEAVKYVYYSIVALYALWANIALHLAKPLSMVIFAANAESMITVWLSMHVLWVTCRYLPEPLRPRLWERAGLVACSLFYATLAVRVLFFTPEGLFSLLRS